MKTGLYNGIAGKDTRGKEPVRHPLHIRMREDKAEAHGEGGKGSTWERRSDLVVLYLFSSTKERIYFAILQILKEKNFKIISLF